MRQPHIFTTDMSKPTIITAQQYGTKVSVELDHSDTSLDELMDAFETLIIGLGYHNDAWKEWILDRANEYQEEENDKWDEDGGFGVKPYTYDDFKRDEENAVRSMIKSKLNEISDEEEAALRYAAEHETPPYPFATDKELQEWSEEDMQTFIDAITEPAEPNENLKKAKKNYDKKLKSKK